jgi:RNA polymerase sigma factor (sigma-70 family)
MLVRDRTLRFLLLAQPAILTRHFSLRKIWRWLPDCSSETPPRGRNLLLLHAELHQPRLHEETIEDLCAEVYRELLNREMAVLRQYSGRSRLSTFLAIIVRRTAVRILLRAARQTALSMPAEDDQFAMIDAEDQGLLQQQSDQLQLAMLRLSPDDQRLLQLFYLEQQDYAQIAREFHLQVNSVGPRLDRARRRLRRLMQTDDDS